MIIQKANVLPDVTQLIADSQSQGFRFLLRLVSDFDAKTNRFDKPGEALFTVSIDGENVAIGGINQDPLGQPKLGRIRRVYVSSKHRGMGIGKELMQHIESWSRPYYDVLTLFTDTEAAARFYETLGYEAVNQKRISHSKKLV